MARMGLEPYAGDWKATWKIFPERLPAAFNTWISFLKFWRNLLLFFPLLCIFGAELFPVFPHSCLSQSRNHKNAAKKSLSKELQFHLTRINISFAKKWAQLTGIFKYTSLLASRETHWHSLSPVLTRVTQHERNQIAKLSENTCQTWCSHLHLLSWQNLLTSCFLFK